jgi:opacity protein-like surface antigen
MKKTSILFILMLSLLCFSTGYAQISLSVNAGGRIPMSSDLRDNSYGVGTSTGFGFSVTAQYMLPGSNMAVQVNAGLDNFKFKNQTTTNYKFQPVTVLAGVRYMMPAPGSMVTPYIGGRIGLVNISDDIPNSNSESAFGWSPEIGFTYTFSPTISLDINTFYISTSKNNVTFSWLGLNAGIALGL